MCTDLSLPDLPGDGRAITSGKEVEREVSGRVWGGFYQDWRVVKTSALQKREPARCSEKGARDTQGGCNAEGISSLDSWGADRTNWEGGQERRECIMAQGRLIVN